MYICNCKGITDSQIKSAIDGGACTKEQLIECFGLGRDCGKCNAEIHGLLSTAGHVAYDKTAEQACSADCDDSCKKAALTSTKTTNLIPEIARPE